VKLKPMSLTIETTVDGELTLDATIEGKRFLFLHLTKKQLDAASKSLPAVMSAFPSLLQAALAAHVPPDMSGVVPPLDESQRPVCDSCERATPTRVVLCGNAFHVMCDACAEVHGPENAGATPVPGHNPEAVDEDGAVGNIDD